MKASVIALADASLRPRRSAGGCRLAVAWSVAFMREAREAIGFANSDGARERGSGRENPPGLGKRKASRARLFSIPASSLRRHQGRTLRDASRRGLARSPGVDSSAGEAEGALTQPARYQAQRLFLPARNPDDRRVRDRQRIRTASASTTDASGASLGRSGPGNLSHGRGLLSRTKEEHTPQAVIPDGVSRAGIVSRMRRWNTSPVRERSERSSG